MTCSIGVRRGRERRELIWALICCDCGLFAQNSSTSGKGHGKSEIIMQTVLWGSLMTKVSPRRGCGSALECQLGTPRDVELGASDWHSKHLQVLVGMSTVQPVHHDVRRHETSCNEGVGGGRWCKRGEFHCHAFPKEKKSLNLGGASCSISSRNLQLVPGESS